MRGSDLLDKMNPVDLAFVMTADAMPYVKTKSRIKLGVIAACICLLTGSITVVAVNNWGIQLIELFTDRIEPGSDYSESGYDLSVSIEKIPVDALTGDIQKLSKVIKQQYQKHHLYSSQSSGLWYLTFESHDQALGE